MSSNTTTSTVAIITVSALVSKAIAIFAAAIVTFGLFYLMQALVGGDGDLNLDSGEKRRFIDLIQNIEDQPPQQMERKVEKPPEPEAPPPEIESPQIEVTGPDSLNVGIGRNTLDTGLDLSSVNLGPSQDGDMLPLVILQPPYPRRANERGIEGWCEVTLAVNPDGTVDAESVVVTAEEPKGYFGRDSIRTARKFKYKPRVVNGKPQRVEGIRYRFTFQLADD